MSSLAPTEPDLSPLATGRWAWCHRGISADHEPFELERPDLGRFAWSR